MCIRDSATSVAGKRVLVVPPLPPVVPGDPNEEQSLVDYITTNGILPDDQPGGSIAGLPVIEEAFQVNIHPLFQPPKLLNTTWYFTVDDDPSLPSYGTRRYFIDHGNAGTLHYYISTYDLGSIRPKDYRRGVDGGPLKNLGCKVGNAFLTPLYNGIGSLNRLVTNQNNLPNITPVSYTHLR